jgi:hydroxymethylglutaryl-CoA reductase
VKTVSGFSKMSKSEKIHWLSEQLGKEAKHLVKSMPNYWHQDQEVQKRFDEFSENTLTNYDLPFGIAPNFLINGKVYSVPMVIEESSVVAAASLGAKFWLERGGFKTTVISTKKVGRVHFKWQGPKEKLYSIFNERKSYYHKIDKEPVMPLYSFSGIGQTKKKTAAKAVSPAAKPKEKKKIVQDLENKIKERKNGKD